MEKELLLEKIKTLWSLGTSQSTIRSMFSSSAFTSQPGELHGREIVGIKFPLLYSLELSILTDNKSTKPGERFADKKFKYNSQPFQNKTGETRQDFEKILKEWIKEEFPGGNGIKKIENFYLWCISFNTLFIFSENGLSCLKYYTEELNDTVVEESEKI